MRLFSIRTTADAAELVADRCWQAGAVGIWEAEGRGGFLSLRVGVEDERAGDFVTALADLAPTDVTDAEAVVLATRTVVVGPPGAEVSLTVPPTVFGDGRHPTTAACLRIVADHARPGCRVLDVGCGSGALSVLAARLGAEVTAIDVDEVAVEATRANARANRVDVDASATTLAAVEGTYDVVVANLSATTVLHLLEELRAHTAAGGTLVLSGILEDRWPEVREAVGGTVRSQQVTDGWATAAIRLVGS